MDNNTTNGSANSLKNILSLVVDVPFTSLASIFVAAAVLFNIGYFSVVVISFITSFSLQESIVFSFIGSILYSLLPIAFVPLFMIAYRRVKRGLGPGLIPFLVAIVAVISVSSILYFIIGFNVIREAVFSVVLTLLAFASAYTIYKYGDTDRRIIGFSFLTLCFIVFSSPVATSMAHL